MNQFHGIPINIRTDSKIFSRTISLFATLFLIKKRTGNSTVLYWKMQFRCLWQNHYHLLLIYICYLFHTSKKAVQFHPQNRNFQKPHIFRIYNKGSRTIFSSRCPDIHRKHFLFPTDRLLYL